MQFSQSIRKIKITLSDYPFLCDIEKRILIAQLTVFEVRLLQEIMHHSLQIPVEQLADALEINVSSLLPILDKLTPLKLYRRENLILFVDREARKYFEFQIEKFCSNFEPNLEYLQNILSKVPIHVLPIWYVIPRSSDNIVASIIEKYLLTPKIYRFYINDLQFEDPILHAIIREVFQPPHFKITAEKLISQFELTRERFEEYLMLLEYHFICSLCYFKNGDCWQEIVTPFAEWLDYLQFEENTRPRVIQESIEKADSEFEFLNLLVNLLHFFQYTREHPKAADEKSKQAINKLFKLGFILQNGDQEIIVSPKGINWLSKNRHEQASSLAADPTNTLTDHAEFEGLWNIRNLGLIENSLKRLRPNEWVKLDDFLKGFINPIGNKEPVTLKRKGKKWKYVIPSYSEQEYQFIKAVIMERLSELGIVRTGSFQESPCFCLTSFGSHFIH